MWIQEQYNITVNAVITDVCQLVKYFRNFIIYLTVFLTIYDLIFLLFILPPGRYGSELCIMFNLKL